MKCVLVALVLSGCHLASVPDSLPTYDPGAFCSLAKLLQATLRVDVSADPPTWIERPDGARTNVEWPVGFSLRMNGNIAEVIDPDGIVVGRDGTELADAGGGASARGEDWVAVCSIGEKQYTSEDP